MSRNVAASRVKPAITEAQLLDIRRTVDAMAGSVGRSVKVHGVIVYLDKAPLKPTCKPAPVQGAPQATTKQSKLASMGAATSQSSAAMTSKQRRSWRRLEERIARRAAEREEQPERQPQPRGEDTGHAAAAMGHGTAPACSSSKPFRTAPPTTSKGPTAMSPVAHPARVKGKPAVLAGARGSHARGMTAWGRGGQGRKAPVHLPVRPPPAKQMPTSAESMRVDRRKLSDDYSDYSEQSYVPDDEMDDL